MRSENALIINGQNNSSPRLRSYRGVNVHLPFIIPVLQPAVRLAGASVGKNEMFDPPVVAYGVLGKAEQ